MDNVRMPIETTRDGNKITKVCVEDVYKMINRVWVPLQEAYANAEEIINSVNKDYTCPDGTVINGELIIGRGVSQPCLTDAFDEEIGSNIAFMKAKLNANIKKHNVLCNLYNAFNKFSKALNDEIDAVDDNILMDLGGIRHHNPDYLLDLEDKLGIERL